MRPLLNLHRRYVDSDVHDEQKLILKEIEFVNNGHIKVRLYHELKEFVQFKSDQNGKGIVVERVKKNKFGQKLFIKYGFEPDDKWYVESINGKKMRQKSKKEIDAMLKRIDLNGGYLVEFKKPIKKKAIKKTKAKTATKRPVKKLNNKSAKNTKVTVKQEKKTKNKDGKVKNIKSKTPKKGKSTINRKASSAKIPKNAINKNRQSTKSPKSAKSKKNHKQSEKKSKNNGSIKQNANTKKKKIKK